MKGRYKVEIMTVDIDGQTVFCKIIMGSILGNRTEVRDILQADNLSDAIDVLRACVDRGDFSDEEG